MRTDLFDFVLPPERIALRPASPRDSARLLEVRPGACPELIDSTVSCLPDLLQPGDALVFNDTRVIPAQLFGRKLGEPQNGARIAVTLHKRIDGSRWRAFARPAKKLRVGDMLRFGGDGRVCFLEQLDARVDGKGEGGEVCLSFAFHGPVLDDAIAERGAIPLPPYIAGRRPADDRDRSDYQTMFAREDGSVAAPTAGLHFTDSLIERIRRREIGTHFVTLHVGAGTFLPVKSEDTADHRMHAEWGTVSEQAAMALNETRARGGRIVAVGSTALRLIESASTPDGTVHPFSGETEIFITPGYCFRAVDVMMTNFHLPRSTLFMLVAAFCGLDVMRRAYAHAIDQGYRFYSYGDACLLFRSGARQGVR
jgi:S-adenosylmethionine:tRNA ribosyltransferase-isomerase